MLSATSRTKRAKILLNGMNVENLSVFCLFKAMMCNLILMLLCVVVGRCQEQHLLDDRISFFILIGILRLHRYKY